MVITYTFISTIVITSPNGGAFLVIFTRIFIKAFIKDFIKRFDSIYSNIFTRIIVSLKFEFTFRKRAIILKTYLK